MEKIKQIQKKLAENNEIFEEEKRFKTLIYDIYSRLENIDVYLDDIKIYYDENLALIPKGLRNIKSACDICIKELKYYLERSKKYLD